MQSGEHIMGWMKRTGIKIWQAVFVPFFFCIAYSAYAQPANIDRVIIHVGGEIVLLSDLESQVLQYREMNPSESLERCEVLQELMLQKMLLHQAALDSVEISDNQVESELDRRLRYFITQFGSEEKLEEYYNKSIIEIKEEFRSMVKEQLLVQTVQQKIIGDLKVTPSEVNQFLKQIPEDSLPLINSEIEFAQIVKIPFAGTGEKERVKNRLEELRNRIVKGEDFGTLAYLYSEDPESAKKNGELGFVERSSLVPEFGAVAFSLKDSMVSEIVETQFGFHIIQLIDRRGDRINVKHILLKPKTSQAEMEVARLKLDTIRKKITVGEISFTDAAIQYSDDQETAKNGGLAMNPYTGSSRFEAPQVDPSVFFVTEKLNAGDLSEPVPFATREGNAYRLIMLKTRTDPHKANLKDDYQKIQELALAWKQHTTLGEWVKKKKKSVYIKVDDEFRNCHFVKELF